MLYCDGTTATVWLKSKVKYLSNCLTLYTGQTLFAVLLLLSESCTMCSLQYYTSVISNSEWNITANEGQCDAPHSQCHDAVFLTGSIHLFKHTFRFQFIHTVAWIHLFYDEHVFNFDIKFRYFILIILGV